MTDLPALQPRELWSIFFELCAIPHPSLKEEALARALLARAQRAGLAARIDPAGNLIVRKEASPGLEGSPGLILQAHLDMVAQVEAGSALDLERDPVLPRLDPSHPGWLCASGSTLGADDGIGVAAGLALLEDAEFRHGPLELLLTVNEEAGMTGARGLEAGSLRGEFLLNLDGEDEAELCVGCSGGLRLKARFAAPLRPLPAEYRGFRLELGGLQGGHSAQDIDKGRGNALTLLGRILEAGGEAAPGLRLRRLEGGSAANAIPREALALLSLPPAEIEAFRRAAETEAGRLAESLRSADPGLHFALSEEPRLAPTQGPDRGVAAGAGGQGEALSPADSARILSCLSRMPQGARAMSADFPGLVTLSSNLGVLGWEPERGWILEALILVRGAREGEKLALGEEIIRHLEGSGAAVERISSYPAWTPELGSTLLGKAREIYREVYGREAEIKATHGGLECGLFRAAFPAWDMLSIGPNIEAPHSPAERVELASVERFWRFLRALVAGLARDSGRGHKAPFSAPVPGQP